MALRVHEAMRRAMRSWPGVTAEATRTQTAFSADRRFAYVWVPTIALRRGPSDPVVSFDLPRRMAAPRIKEAYEAKPGLWVHHVPVRGPEDVDAELLGWVRAAYEERGRRPDRSVEPARR